MANSILTVPKAINEPVKSYAPGSSEKEELIATYKKMYAQEPIDIPMYIGSEKIYTNNKKRLHLLMSIKKF
jgi:1-pyrroline-5-carboxylate dehydrogenase